MEISIASVENDKGALSPRKAELEKPPIGPKPGWLKEELARNEEEQRIDSIFTELRQFYGRPSVQKKISDIIRDERRTDALKLAAELRAKADALERVHK